MGLRRAKGGADQGLAFIGIAGLVAVFQEVGEVELRFCGPEHRPGGLIGLHPGAEVVDGQVEAIHGDGELPKALPKRPADGDKAGGEQVPVSEHLVVEHLGEVGFTQRCDAGREALCPGGPGGVVGEALDALPSERNAARASSRCLR